MVLNLSRISALFFHAHPALKAMAAQIAFSNNPCQSQSGTFIRRAFYQHELCRKKEKQTYSWVGRLLDVDGQSVNCGGVVANVDY
jgi:hypothetical protein